MAVTKTAQTAASKGKAPLAHGVGRRKSSVARVWVTRGKGSVTINGKPYNEYFDTEITRSAAVFALEVYPAAIKSCDIKVNVQGGGLCGQADATKLGIARAIVSMYDDARETLRQHKLLTVDSRLKERKKYGQKGARRKFQFVKR